MDIHSPCQDREGVERPCQRKEEGHRLDRGEWDAMGWAGGLCNARETKSHVQAYDEHIKCFDLNRSKSVAAH